MGGVVTESMTSPNTTLGYPETEPITGCTVVYRFAINTVTASAICCFGLVGNTISFVVLSKDREAPVASLLLQALAFVDNLFLSVWVLHFSISDLLNYMEMDHGLNVSWLLIRVYTYPLLFIGQTGTIWMIVLIAISRYFAVCKPYKAIQYSTMATIKKAIAVVFAFAVLYNIPRFFETRICEIEKNGTNHYTLERTTFGNTVAYGLLYFDTLYYIFSFVLPLIMLTFLNIKLTLAYRRVRYRRNSMTMRQENSNREQNISLVMIVVILAFILCNAPARVVQIIWGYIPQECPSLGFFLIEISNVLEVLNSSSNFIIYCIFRSQFRNILYNRLFNTRESVDMVITDFTPREDPGNQETVSTSLTAGPDWGNTNSATQENGF